MSLKTKEDLSNMLSVGEVAIKLGVSVNTVWRYRNIGLLPCHKFGGQTIRFTIEDVEKMLAEGRQDYSQFQTRKRNQWR